MRGKVYSSVVLSALGVLGGFWLLARQDKLQTSMMSLRAQTFESADRQRFNELAALARDRALEYDRMLSQENLSDGLVVGRNLQTGKATSACDSLLFSSLRFVALKKLGADEKAQDAFDIVARENYWRGRWIRHPDCRRKSTSRDMIVGLMAAMTMEPSGHEDAFAKLLGVVARTGGSVDDGPFYVSRLTPGLLEMLKQMATVRGYSFEALPASMKVGFSTVEFDSWKAAPGFRAHLNALTLWIELELLSRHPEMSIRSLSAVMDQFSPSWGLGFQVQRRMFAADSLYKVDKENMFFEYLRLRAAGALSFRERARLLAELLESRAFPADRLPQDCDRGADYMWQRHSIEYRGKSSCHEQFPGVDFMFMVGLLTADVAGR